MSDPFCDTRLRPDLFHDVQHRCYILFTLDLFADRVGHTALAAEWRCPELIAFEADLTGFVVWAHPPRELVRAALDFFVVCSIAILD